MKLDMDEHCEHVHKDAPYGATCEDCWSSMWKKLEKDKTKTAEKQVFPRL